MPEPTARFRVEAVNATAGGLRSSLDSINTFGEKARGLLRGAIGGIAIAEIVQLGREALNAGDELAKAATKAGVSGETISQLSYAAKLADVDLASLSTSLKFMQVALSNAATGGKEQNDALRALGLTFQQLQGLAPDKQFELLADRISQLTAPADRARAAVAFFGRAGADLLPLFEQGAAGIQKAREEAIKFGSSFSTAQLKQVQEANDSVKRLSESFAALGLSIATKAAPALTSFFAFLRTAITQEDLSTPINKLRVQIAFLERMRGQSFTTAGPDSPIAAGNYTAEQAEKLLAELKSQQQSLEASIRRAPRAAATVTGGKAPGFEEQQREEAAAKAAAAQAKYIDQLQQLSATATEKQIQDYIRANDANEQLHALGVISEATYLNRKATLRENFFKEENDAAAKHFEELNTLTETDLERTLAAYDKKVAALNELFSAGKISAGQFKERFNEALDDTLKPVEVSAKRIVSSSKDSLDQMSIYAKRAAENMQDAFADFLFDPFADGLKGMLKGFIDIIRKMVAQAAAAEIFGSKDSGGLGLGDLITGLFKGITGRAVGGDVSQGTPYWVGETGRELFVPSQSGTIVPHGMERAGGGRSPVVINHTQNNHFSGGATQQDLKRAQEETIKYMSGLIQNGKFT